MDDKKLKILIADDEDGLRLSMAGIIEMEGHEVLDANDGYGAIELAKQHSFDIAFLDIKMPGINGVETFKAIKKISPETVVVMMTAYAVGHLIKEAISEGAYACINKPFDMEKIMETIKDVSKKPFIVVIEDDQALCEVMSKKFKDQGFNVATKTSATEGEELLERKIPDVILLDTSISGANSIDTFKKIKERLGDKCPKTILLGTTPPDSNIEEIKKLGVVEYLQKPLNTEGMKSAIDKLLDKNNKLKICIVDDNKPFCDSLKSALSSGGYDVDTAYSGDEALTKMTNEEFKIVILDIRLPDVNGVEIYEKIKNLRPGIGVIFVSGYSQDENVKMIAKNNNYIYLHKPFDPENLIKLLDEIKEFKNRVKS